jgi:hypothetical protein
MCRNNKIINLQNVINSFAKKVPKIVLRRLFSYRETHKKSNAIFNWQVGTFYKTFLIHHNIKTKVKIVTKKKIFDLDPGKLYFINKRVKLREKKYFLNLRKNSRSNIFFFVTIFTLVLILWWIKKVMKRYSLKGIVMDPLWWFE